MKQMRVWGYDPLLSSDDLTRNEMMEKLRKWYHDSCGLRFISAVRTVEGDPNDGFITLIGQGEDYDDVN
jgi:hypothetical protein